MQGVWSACTLPGKTSLGRKSAGHGFMIRDCGIGRRMTVSAQHSLTTLTEDASKNHAIAVVQVELTLFSETFWTMAKMAASATTAIMLSLPAMTLRPPPARLIRGGAMNSASASAIAPHASKTSCTNVPQGVNQQID